MIVVWWLWCSERSAVLVGCWLWHGIINVQILHHTGQIVSYTDIFDEESHEYEVKHLVDY